MVGTPQQDRPRNSLLAIHLIVLILLVLPLHAPADEAARKIGNAEGHFQQGRYLEALNDYQDVIEQSRVGEHQAKALMMSATIHGTFLKDPQKALRLYEQVRTTYPGSPYEADAIFQTAVICYERDQHGEASRLFDLYLKKFPAGDKKDAASFLRDASSGPPAVQQRKTLRQEARPKKNPHIRVLVLERAAEARVSASSSMDVVSPSDSRVLMTLPPLREARVRFDDGILSLNGTACPLTELLFLPLDGRAFRINGTAYRGVLKLFVTGDGRLDGVNVVDVEEYLYGVVPREMPPGWPEEALKAQAVVSRTFARYQMDANAARDFDISATTASQVYGGIAAESEKTRLAVDATRGRTLTHSGRPALTYFHANSGGMTEDARHVWRVAVPYLQCVPDDYSARAPGTAWTSFLSFEQIRDALVRNGVRVGPISNIETAALSPSGRAIRMKITHGAGTMLVGGNEFRTMTDPVLIKSTLFRTERSSRGIRFDGRGSGHGVGMSQWGARIMAEGGSPYREILLHYYKGLELN